MAYDIFNLVGTATQNGIILDALQRTNFPWEKLESKLLATKNKTKIPVEWADLSAYGAQASKAEAPREVVSDEDHDHEHDDDHEHEEGETVEGEISHFHVEDEDGNTAHGIAYRERTLGLAWYSGKVSIDISLESNPTLAKEVFLSEGAHMVDFFFMTDKQRTEIFNAFHGNTAAPAPHGHGWFDVGGYNTWVGEAFMGGFVKAYSPFPVTIPFVHPPTDYTSKRIREILTPEPVQEPAPTPLPSPAPERTPPTPSPKPTDQYVSTQYTPFFHRNHAGYRGSVIYATRDEAVAARKIPCFTCRP